MRYGTVIKSLLEIQEATQLKIVTNGFVLEYIGKH
jgi:hypothetical protein